MGNFWERIRGGAGRFALARRLRPGAARGPRRPRAAASCSIWGAALLALAAAAAAASLAAAPASAAVEVGEPSLTLNSTYKGELEAALHAEPAAGEVENLKVKEEFTVAAEQRIDTHGHTIVLRKVEVTGSETGTVGDGKGSTEEVGCSLSPGEGHRPADFTPEGAAPKEHIEEEQVTVGERKGEAFTANPALDYEKFSMRTFLPTDSLGPPANEVKLEKKAGKSARSCVFAETAGSNARVENLTCMGGGEGGESFKPYAPQEGAIPFEGPPHVFAPMMTGTCKKTPSGAEETLNIKGTVSVEALGAKQVREAKAQEEKEAREKAEEEARKKKEAEERKKAEEEAARKVEVPKPPPPPPPPPPASAPPPEAIVAPEGPAPKRLTPAQFRRRHKGHTSPSDRARNKALQRALTAATKVKTAKCTVALAIDGAIDAVSFVNAIPGEQTSGGAVTDLGTRRCLTLLAQLRTGLAVARHDPPSPRYPAIRLPARAAAAVSSPCTPAALPPAQFAACDGLAAADRESDRQLERVALVAAAVAGTIERHSGAVTAGRQTDAEFQDIAYNALVAELGQSLERAAEANAALARALGGAGTDVAFGHALAAHTARHIEHLVKRASGPLRASLRTLLGAAQLAVPSLPASYRAALSLPLPVGPLADGGTFKPRQLILLVRQLVKQSQIPAALGAAMVADLGQLKKAKGAAATAVRLSLGAAIRQLTSEAGPLLEAATRIRSPRL